MITGVIKCYSESAFNIEDLFANGELGDYWRYDLANTDANALNDPFTTATGLVNGLVMNVGDPTKTPEIIDLNGVEVGDFGTPSDRMVYNFGGAVPQPGTIIIAIQSVLDLASRVVYSGSAVGSRWQLSINSTSDIISFAGLSLDSGRDKPFGTHIITSEFNGASSSISFRGDGGTSSLATGNAGSQSTDQICLGSLWDGTIGAGFICPALLMIDRLLTASEKDGVEQLFATFFEIDI
jgi:hypothetical protein